MSTSIFETVRTLEDNYIRGTTKISKYVDFSMHETIETVDAYLNSKHTSGAKDALGRVKPFFNIVTAAVNIWYRATDIDRKDIRVLPGKTANTMLAFMATVLLQEWMRKERFGVFLNDWGRNLARYGSTVVKFVEREGSLIPSVLPWNRVICDPVDFDAAPVVEMFYLSESQLIRRATKGDPEYCGYDLEVARDLIETRKEGRKTLDRSKKDTMDEFIPIYEVHGNMELSMLTENEEDDDKFAQQIHVLTYLEDGKGSYKDFALYRGKERRSPYMLTHLIKEDGRTLSIGAVEYLFDAQWMVNHTMKNMKDQLDLASKLIFQTADSQFLGRNVLTAIQGGEILITQENKPLTEVPNVGHDITSLNLFKQQWDQLSQNITSTPDAIRGNTMPSGTPYSLAAILQQQPMSLFEIMTENKGLAIEDMMREFVIPHLKKQMDTADEVQAILDDSAISQVDSMYVPREAIRRYNARTIDTLLNTPQNGELSPIQPFDAQQEQQAVKQELGSLGNSRFFKPSDIDGTTWKEVLKDLEWELIVEVTNEQADKQAVLATLSSALQTVAGNPAILQDPNGKLLFSKILSQTGTVSPMEVSASTSAPTPVGGGSNLQAQTA